MNHWFKRRLSIEDKGMAAIEFALILPVLLVMLAGIYDVSNLILCENKVNQTAQNLSNIITRGNLTKVQLDTILKAASLIMQPFDFNTNGKVIVSSYSQVNAKPPPTLMWTNSYGGGGGTTQITPGSLPGGIVLNNGQTVVFTEVFYNYTGVFTNYGFTSKSLYQLAAGMPRQGLMTTLP